ncbi:MAG: hypothetical protein BGO29_12280 [Bacteroidales bacterium 36-12]|nr:MAG: hypothetical protein BGO29_12280 [Bacteroidales bacterium 36-12]
MKTSYSNLKSIFSRYYSATTQQKYNLNIIYQSVLHKQIAIAERGEGTQTISASEFKVGMYLYNIITDSKKVDVKRMILTEYEVNYEKNHTNINL